MAFEHVRVGNERGVQGRFKQQIGQAVSIVCVAAGIDASFGDYKSTAERGRKSGEAVRPASQIWGWSDNDSGQEAGSWRKGWDNAHQ